MGGGDTGREKVYRKRRGRRVGGRERVEVGRAVELLTRIG